MATPEVADVTTVSERYAATIPAAVRSRLDIRPGDRIRWAVGSSGDLEVAVIRSRARAFEDFEPAELGPTNAAEDVDAVLAEDIDEER
ncbi:MAG: AbrB/MazE/SpoVT family DNA-binding domain-containing protein [Halobacteriales archaeon]|nr:AbrB/MazE/SpoVT family DNA-binding domain-containing protein [Halobacteriales archaeon]